MKLINVKKPLSWNETLHSIYRDVVMTQYERRAAKLKVCKNVVERRKKKISAHRKGVRSHFRAGRLDYD